MPLQSIYSFSKKLFIMFTFIYLCLYVHHMHAEPVEARRGQQIPLEPELQEPVKAFYMDAGSPTLIFHMSTKHS